MSHWYKLVGAIVAIGLIAGLIPLTVTLAAQQDSEIAKGAAEQFLTGLGAARPDWAGGELAEAWPLSDIHGNTIAYLFGIRRGERTLGMAIVGNASYGWDVLQMTSAPPPSLPNSAELQTIVARDLGAAGGLDISPLSYVSYLGPDRLFAVYSVNGTLVGVDLAQKRAKPLEYLETSLVSAQEYLMAKAEPANGESQTLDDGTAYRENYMPIRYMGWDHSPTPTPVGTPIPIEWRNNNNCGPTSGAMVDEFYKQARGYTLFNDWAQDHNRLYDLMETNVILPGTTPGHARDGFIAYAQERGYGVDFNNTEWWWTDDVFFDSFPVIKQYADSHDALMILFTWVPERPPGEPDPADWHYYAIRGYWDGPSLPDFIIANKPVGLLRVAELDRLLAPHRVSCRESRRPVGDARFNHVGRW